MPESTIPHIRVSVSDGIEEVLELGGYIEDAMVSQGYCRPGEEYLVCCEQAYFENVVLDRRSAAWAMPHPS